MVTKENLAHERIVLCKGTIESIGLNSLETRMKVSSQNYYSFKKPLILAQTIRSSYNSAHFKNVFLKMGTKYFFRFFDDELGVFYLKSKLEIILSCCHPGRGGGP